MIQQSASKDTEEGGETMERRTKHLMGGYHLAKDSARLTDVDAETGHNGCTMMMILIE